MAKFTPTQEQNAILTHDLGPPARILAGPGTGKSATLVALVNNTVLQKPNSRIRLLTFTRAATGELARKISDHPTIATQRPSTVHSFALLVLLKNPGAGNLPQPLRIADDWEDKNIVRKTLSRRINVPVVRLGKLFKELAANWQSGMVHLGVIPAELFEDGQIAHQAMRAKLVGRYGKNRPFCHQIPLFWA